MVRIMVSMHMFQRILDKASIRVDFAFSGSPWTTSSSASRRIVIGISDVANTYADA